MHYYGGFYQLVETCFHILTVGVSRPLHIALCVSLEWSMKYGLLPEEKINHEFKTSCLSPTLQQFLGDG